MAIINGSVGKNGYSFYAELIETIPSNYIETNRTNYSLKIYVKNGNTRFNSNNWTKYLKINGVEVYNDSGQNINSTVVGYNQAFAVMTVDAGQPHNDDGTYTVSIEASLSKDSYSSYDPGYCYLKGDIQLTTIPRASSVLGFTGDVGYATTIYIDRKSTSFTHTLTYNFQGLTGTIATGVGGQVAWVLPSSFYQKIGGKTAVSGTVYCQTYNGSTAVGSATSAGFLAYPVEADCLPNISATIADTNTTATSLTGSNTKLIKFVSNPKITINATAKNYASISSKRVVCGDNKSGTGDAPILYNVESGAFTISAKDSRGYSRSISQNVSIVDYVKLTLNADIYRPSQTGSELKVSFDGNYFNGSFGNTNNSLTIKYRYKTTGGDYGDYKTLTATISGNKYTGDISLGNDFDYQTSYEFEFIATDKVGSTTPLVIPVSRGVPIWARFENHIEAWGKKIFFNNDNEVVIGSDIGTKSYLNKEVVAGTWLDGSLIYKKDFYYENLQSSSSSVLSLNTHLTNIKVVDTNVSVQIHNSKEDVVSNYYKSNTDHCNIHFYTSDGYIQYDCAFPDNPTYDALFTIYYRKLS